jgi:hypothetical protein
MPTWILAAATTTAVLVTIVNLSWLWSIHQRASEAARAARGDTLESDWACEGDCVTARARTPQTLLYSPFKPDPEAVWYFHHIPKCAGTAAEQAMRSVRSFANGVVRDDGIAGPKRKLGKNLLPGSVITGHWPAGAFQRYPQLLSMPDKHRLFAIIRDPWSTRVSLFWYHRRLQFIPPDTDLVKYMLSEPNTMQRIRTYRSNRPHKFWYAQQPMVLNYLPYYFKCHNESHCAEVLNRYAYIGVLHQPDAPNPLLPLTILKNGHDRAGAPNLMAFSRTNRRQTKLVGKGTDYAAQMARLDTKANRSLFRTLNALDYWVYDRCLQRYLNDWHRLVTLHDE